jgi:Cys-tRNA(Pro) deacylase
MRTTAMQRLDEAGIAYVVRRHSRPVFTVEEAAAERGVSAGQIVKVVLVRKSDRTLAAALLPGDRKLSLKKLSAALGDKRICMAPPALIEQTTGMTVGAISAAGLPAGMPIYVDEGVARQAQVAISSGDPEAGLLLASSDLLKLVGGVRGDFAA